MAPSELSGWPRVWASESSGTCIPTIVDSWRPWPTRPSSMGMSGKMSVAPDPALVERVGRMFAPASPVRWARAERGYSHAQRWVVGFDSGPSVFVKAAADGMTADWLRAEHHIYSQVQGDYLPRMLGWEDDDERPVLVLDRNYPYQTAWAQVTHHPRREPS